MLFDWKKSGKQFQKDGIEPAPSSCLLAVRRADDVGEDRPFVLVLESPSINPSIHRSIDPSIYRSIDQSIHDPPIHRSISPSIHQYTDPSFDPSIHPSLH
jgi:hypothetical protein